MYACFHKRKSFETIPGFRMHLTEEGTLCKDKVAAKHCKLDLTAE